MSISQKEHLEPCAIACFFPQLGGVMTKGGTTAAGSNSQAKLSTHMFTSATLRQQPFVPELTSLINEAYWAHYAGLIPTTFPRFNTDTQLLEEIEDGLAAVVFLDDLIVATASVKPWLEAWPWEDGTSMIVKREKREGEVLDYEFTAVAVRYGPLYLGKGYADTAMRTLHDEMVRRLAVGKKEGEREGRFWVRINEELTGDYWRRKGFHVISDMWCEKGKFGNKRRFVVSTMTKEIFGVNTEAIKETPVGETKDVVV
jgi:hypothetical protein